MSVFDLKDETDDTVSRETLDEIQASLHESLAWLVPVLFQEVVVKIDLKGLTDLVSTVCVGDHLNDPSQKLVITSSVADAFVRSNIKIQVTLLEDLLEQFDKL